MEGSRVMTGPPCVGLIGLGSGSTHLIEDFLSDYRHPDYHYHNDHQHHQQYHTKVNVGNDRAPLCRPNKGRGALI